VKRLHAVKRLRRNIRHAEASLPLPKGPKALRGSTGIVSVEPLLLHAKYSVVRWGLWRKVESTIPKNTAGIVLRTPLCYTSVRYLYEMSHLLNSLYWLSHYSKSRRDVRDAVSIHQSVISHLRRRCKIRGVGVINAYLTLIAINLRVAKSRLRRAGQWTVGPPPINRGYRDTDSDWDSYTDTSYSDRAWSPPL